MFHSTLLNNEEEEEKEEIKNDHSTPTPSGKSFTDYLLDVNIFPSHIIGFINRPSFSYFHYKTLHEDLHRPSATSFHSNNSCPTQTYSFNV